MAIVRVNRNLSAEMTHSLSNRGPMERVLGGAASDIARTARGIARREFYRRGGYARGIHAETGLDEHGELVGRVVATDFKSHWAERGFTANGRRVPGKHILARAAAQEGYRALGGALLGALGGGVPVRRAVGARRRRAIGARR
jgi:hypothetical protein